MIKNKLKKIMTYILSVMMMFAMIPTIVDVEAARGGGGGFPGGSGGQTTTPNTITTLDTKGLINIWMYDYTDGDVDYSQLDGNNTVKYNETTYYNVTQGLVENKLSNGNPVSTKSNYNKELTYFNKTINSENESANHLFVDNNGYYEYSSFKNAAYFDPDTNNFTVYDALVTPQNNSENYVYQRGNFFPYNTINYNEAVGHNLYDENGEKLNSDDDGYHDNLYGFNEDVNYQFGMKIEATFVQTENGQYNDSDMIYTFNGDDDLWVFIDGVLVLDIGGVHDAHTGTINFATGDVDVDLGSEVDGNKLVKKKAHTTIKEMYEKAKVFPDGTQWDLTKVGDYFDGNTFVDYTDHDFTMFYMERGRGASNLHMKFNLPLVPQGQLQIGKQLTEFSSNNYGDVKFGFKLEIEDDYGRLQKVTNSMNEKYAPHVGELNSETGEALEWDATGTIFYLQPNEYATFKNIPKNKKYQVTEVNVQSDEFDQVKILGTDYVATGTDGQQETGYNAESPVYTVGTKPLIVFMNKVSVANKKTLKITKKMANGLHSTDTFTVLVKMEDKDGNLSNYSGSYTIKNKDGSSNSSLTNNGLIQLQVNQSALITDILSDTEFQVIEQNIDNKYNDPQYSVNTKINDDGNTTEEYVKNNKGTIELGFNAEVIITNSYKLGSLTINKKITNIDKVDLNNGDPIFTFVIENESAGIKLYKTIRFSKLSNETESITIDNLPYGDYTVTEENVIRYKCTSANPNTVTINNTENTVNFTNELKNKNNFSDTDFIENYFSVNKTTGKISWKKKTSSSETNTN